MTKQAQWQLVFAVVLLLGCSQSQGDESFYKAKKIIAFGDSLTYGTGASKEESYPKQLSKMLGKEILNAGVPGNTSCQALKRVESDVLSQKPDLVILLIGGNDYLKRVPLVNSKKCFRQILLKLTASNAKILHLSLDPPLLGKKVFKSFNKIAEESAVMTLEDVMDGLWNQKAYMTDAVHPNASGYKLIAEKVLEYLKAP